MVHYSSVREFICKSKQISQFSVEGHIENLCCKMTHSIRIYMATFETSGLANTGNHAERQHS